MKKKLEAELISIAHRILKLKDKSDLILLHQESQKLYETLSVLRFFEQNFEGAKPTIGRAEVETRLEEILESKSVQTLEIPEDSIPEITNAFNPITVFMPEEESEDRNAKDEDVSVLENTVTEQEQEVEELPWEVSEENDSEEETETSFIQEGFESYEAESQEVPEYPVAQEIEPESAPEIVMPQIIEIGGEPETEEEEEPEEEPEEMEEMEEDKLNSVDHEEPVVEEKIVERPSWMNNDFDTQEDKQAPIEISFADLLGHDYNEPIFERVEDLKSSVVETPVFEKESNDISFEEILPKVEIPEVSSESHFEESVAFDGPPAEEPLHLDHLKPIAFGLNDKIGFEKYLFGGSGEEMHRVISQLQTFGTFEEAQEFIQDMVKPDYNNWEGKEDYEQRFMEIVERRFL